MLRMVLNPIVYPVRSVHSLGATIGPTQPSVKLSTVGGLVFVVAGATIRNSLPDNDHICPVSVDLLSAC